MAFVPKKQAFNASINAVTLGTGDKSIVLGGENVMPFYTFDAPIENAPKIGVEISDLGMEDYQAPGLQAFYAWWRYACRHGKKGREYGRRQLYLLAL